MTTATETQSSKQTLGFEAEVKQVLDLMIHSLYSNKEIFLRELISNASDAADKLRFSALSNEALYEGDGDLKIHIRANKDDRTITISDNGIGMDLDEVKQNIGTIAHSGTKKFFDKLTGDESKDSQLIGQFGVGFYSSYIVADRVTLTSRKAGAAADEGVRWESEGAGTYTIEPVTKQTRGTEVVLHLREGEDEFLESFRLRGIIHKFSEHIDIPILMPNEFKGEDQDAPDEETVNSATALWTKSRNEISEEDYNAFYKTVAHDYQDPLAHLHSKVEGTNEYTLLLYIPATPPFDLWDRESKHGVKLYVKRTFIMEGHELMPRYLRFIRGVMDSDSLPLNVSREILQQSKQIDQLRSGAVKKVLSLLEHMARNDQEKFQTFWSEFGPVLKEGPIEDFKNKDRIAKLLRFASTRVDGGKQTLSLEDYVGRMVEGQDTIYYITAETMAAAKNSPHLEIFRKKGVEVLLLTDHVDEWLVQHLTEFDGKQLQSVAKGDLDLDAIQGSEEDKADKPKSETKALKSVIKQLKKSLKDKVQDVRLSKRLTESPACLVSEEHSMGANMERILKAAGQKAPTSLPIFEINGDHALITRLSNETDDDRFDELAHLLFEQAVLSEGGQLDDPAAFVHRLNGLLQNLLK